MAYLHPLGHTNSW